MRRPGVLSSLPPDKRGRFGYCQDHRADAEAKLAAAIGTITPSARNSDFQSGAKGNRPLHGNAHEPEQGALDL